MNLRDRPIAEMTLGLFVHGIPAIFAPTAIALRTDPRLQSYLRFYRECHQGVTNSASWDEELSEGYERFVTPIHETRHFHDALLSWPLFELFLCRWAMLLDVFQVPGHLTLNENDLPIHVHLDRDRLSDEASIIIDRLIASRSRFERIWVHLNAASTILGGEYSGLSHLLETNAVVSELLHLKLLHGWDVAQTYYHARIKGLPPPYHGLIDRFLRTLGSLQRAVDTLYFVVPYCLYGDRNPRELLDEILREHDGAPDKLRVVCNAASLKALFDDERRREDQLPQIRSSGKESTDRNRHSSEDTQVRELLRYDKVLYRCRRLLIDSYVERLAYDSRGYYEQLHELPIPPLLFFPLKEIEPGWGGVPEAAVLRRGDKYLPLLGAHDDSGERIVLAGLTTYGGWEPCVSLDGAEAHLQAAYYCARLFGEAEKQHWWRYLIDAHRDAHVEMEYERLFKKRFLSGASAA